MPFLKEQVSRKAISSSVFTMNEHYLVHLHRVLRHMGPLPVYAAFAMERAIGEIKSHINSKSNPGKNGSNVVVDLAATRYREKHIEANSNNQESQKQAITADNDKEGTELWLMGTLYPIHLFNIKHHMTSNVGDS